MDLKIHQNSSLEQIYGVHQIYHPRRGLLAQEI